MNTIEIRKELKMNEKEFADEFGIPVETVKYWDSEDCMPDYVFNLVKHLSMWRMLYKKKIIDWVKI